MSEAPEKKSKTGLFAIIAILVIAAVAALAFLSGSIPGQDGKATTETAAVQKAQSQEAAQAAQQAQAAEQPQLEIKPGNPVVATVNGEDIMRSDVFQFIANLPENMRQLPVDQLFQMSVNQLVNAKLIESRAKKSNLGSDPQVQEQLQQAKEQIVRNVYLQKQVEERISEEKLRELYDAYAARMAEVPETKARHILVEDEATAKTLIKKAKSGTDFAELAKENSTGPSAPQGGELGWFAQGEMVPEFSEAAFKIEPGQVGEQPVKTQFGWHVIKVEDRRMRPVAPYEEVKPMLETQVRRQVLDNMVDEWRSESSVEIYDINGEPVKKAEEATDSQPAPAEPATEETAAPAPAPAAQEKAAE